jgi:hypothetical protein
LIPVPVSGGARGTAPGSGQSTRKETPSSANRSPVDSRSLRTRGRSFLARIRVRHGSAR